MKFNPLVNHRRSIRLRDYDYSIPGAYFVTLVTKNKHPLFGNLAGDRVTLNALAEIIRYNWLRLPRFFPIQMDEWVIMPNHLHGIIWIIDRGKSDEMLHPRKGEAFDEIIHSSTESDTPNVSPLQQRRIGTQQGSLGAIIQNFKSTSTRKINQFLRSNHKGEAFDKMVSAIQGLNLSNASPLQVWQRNYFERIIRNEKELDQIRAYIIDNPRRWMEEKDQRI